ncbi:MAG: efflux RND transporter periplasmic adaptor subunit [Elainellaceae cyanobacterium]
MVDESPNPQVEAQPTLAAPKPHSVPESETQAPRRSKKSYWPAIALALVAIFGLGSWRIYQRLTAGPSGEIQTSATDSLPVQVVRVQTGVVEEWVFDEGVSLPVTLEALTFEASGTVTYLAKVNGVPLKAGDLVSQGQLLATIDNRKQTASITAAEADVQVAVSQRNQAEASLQEAQANLAQAESDLALAQSELRRNQYLFEQGVISESDRDVAKNEANSARARLETARQSVASAEEGVISAQASVEAAQASRNSTAVDLEDTQLVASSDGVVAYINIQELDYWNTQYLNTSNAQSLIDTVPIVVVNPESFEVRLEVQSSNAAAIRPGQRVYAVPEDQVNQSQAIGASQQALLDIARQQGSTGTVFAVSPSQTPEGRGTEVTIRNLQPVRNLTVNGRVYVWIEVDASPDAVVVPVGAVTSRGQETYVFVVNEADNTVQRRLITEGIRGFSEVGVLSGVRPGELVVVEGQNRLTDGAPVEIVGQESAKSESVTPEEP